MKLLKVGAGVVVLGVLIVVGGSRLVTGLIAPRTSTTFRPGDPALAERGRDVAQESDCVACHTAPGGSSFAGGLALQTPAGILYSTNITPDRQTGIGAYEFADFERAVRHGVRKDGAPLYPAMPYVSYAVLSDADVQALYAYFTTQVPAVSQANQAPSMRWPASLRWPLAWWQLLFGRHRGFSPPGDATADIARGAYLVQGAGHCGACHTPRGVAYQERALEDGADGLFLSGSELEGWYAKSLRQERDGLAGWTREQLAGFLRTGRNERTAAFGSMAQVVEHSAQHLSDDDATAVAAYLMSLQPRSGHSATATTRQDSTTAALYDNADRRPGALGYVARCAPCHRLNGQGTARLFPALAGNPVVTTDNPNSLIQITLAGGAMAHTPADKTRPSMPELAKLDDQTIADILSFVRSSWGNEATAVSAREVAAMRLRIAARPRDYVPGDAR